MGDLTWFQSDLFYRKRGTAADEFGKLGSDFGYEEDSEVKSILVSRVEDMKKKASAIDAMMSICKVGTECGFEVERDRPVQRVLQGRHQLSPGGHRPFARGDSVQGGRVCGKSRCVVRGPLDDARDCVFVRKRGGVGGGRI